MNSDSITAVKQFTEKMIPRKPMFLNTRPSIVIPAREYQKPWQQTGSSEIYNTYRAVARPPASAIRCEAPPLSRPKSYNANTDQPIWLAAGVRSPFIAVDGPFAGRDSLALSVAVGQAMAA